MSKSCFSNTKPKLLNYIDFNFFTLNLKASKRILAKLSVIVVTHKMIVITFLHQSYINMLPKRKSRLGETMSPMLIKPYVRPSWKDQVLKLRQIRLKTLLTLEIKKKQDNYIANLNKEAKLEYFSNFESNDNKLFWVNCKPYFTNKHDKADADIMLSENVELILKSKEIANNFNDHFRSNVDDLSLDHWDGHSLSLTKGSDRIDNIIKRYRNYPSI